MQRELRKKHCQLTAILGRNGLDEHGRHEVKHYYLYTQEAKRTISQKNMTWRSTSQKYNEMNSFLWIQALAAISFYD